MSKRLERAYKNLDAETISTIEAMDVAGLKQRIVEAEQGMAQAERELDENPQYQELKESLKAVTAGMKEVKKRQNSVITVALSVIESKGQ